MDRPIEGGIRRTRILKLTTRIGLALIVLVAGITALKSLVAPSVERGDIRIATVEQGTLESSITASGHLVPGFEQVLASPISSRVLRILKEAGQTVMPGEPILELDLGDVKLALDRIEEQLALKHKERRAKMLDWEKTTIDLEGRRDVMQMLVKSKHVRRDRYQRLFDNGLISEENLLENQLELETKTIEMNQLNKSILNVDKLSQTEQDSITVEIRLLEKERDRQLTLLERATTRADRAGILTWVVEEEGSSIGEGDVLARIADENFFKVVASLSDVYSPRLKVGLPVKVKLDQQFHEAVLELIPPASQDGRLNLIIALKEPGFAGFKSNLRVETHVITHRIANTLRVRIGPFANGSGLQDVFVINDGVAYRRSVDLGAYSHDYVEVKSGLSPGDEVIISEMSRYLHLSEIPVN